MRSARFPQKSICVGFLGTTGTQKTHILIQERLVAHSSGTDLTIPQNQLFYDLIVNRCQAMRSSEPAICGS